MTLTQRVGRILSALLSLLSALIMIKLEENGFRFVGLMLSLSLILVGIRNIIFYFTMARHMVDGRGVFYIGVIVLDFGLFTLSLSERQSIFIVLYLLGFHAFSGGMNILHALEARKYEAPSWRMNMAEGVVNILFAAAAVLFGFFTGDMQKLTMIYAAGLLYSAAAKTISAFRKTAIVYIP